MKHAGQCVTWQRLRQVYSQPLEGPSALRVVQPKLQLALVVEHAVTKHPVAFCSQAVWLVRTGHKKALMRNIGWSDIGLFRPAAF